nr:hypothetical protein [Segetibacter sp.]
ALSRAQQVGQLVFSSATLTELEEVLGRPKFKKYILNSTPAEVFASITDAAIIMVGTDKSDFHCRDKKDHTTRQKGKVN